MRFLLRGRRHGRSFSTASYIIVVGTLIILSASCSGKSPEETDTVEVLSGTATTVSFDGVPIAYESVGTGTPTLVFVQDGRVIEAIGTHRLGRFLTDSE